MTFPPPSIGRVVHYVDEAGRCVAAIVTGVGPHPDADGTVDLTTFGRLVPSQCEDAVPHAEDAPTEDGRPPRTWHWPERVG